MKLYTVAVYDLRMCMKGDDPRPKSSREIIIYAGQGILCD